MYHTEFATPCNYFMFVMAQCFYLPFIGEDREEKICPKSYRLDLNSGQKHAHALFLQPLGGGLEHLVDLVNRWREPVGERRWQDRMLELIVAGGGGRICPE